MKALQWGSETPESKGIDEHPAADRSRRDGWRHGRRDCDMRVEIAPMPKWLSSVFSKKARPASPPPDLLSAFGALLENLDGFPLIPESRLPAPVDQLKAALLAEAVQASRDGMTAYVEALRNVFPYLGTVVSDDVALDLREFTLTQGASGSARSDDFGAAIERRKALLAEFDATVNAAKG